MGKRKLYVFTYDAYGEPVKNYYLAKDGRDFLVHCIEWIFRVAWDGRDNPCPASYLYDNREEYPEVKETWDAFVVEVTKTKQLSAKRLEADFDASWSVHPITSEELRVLKKFGIISPRDVC